MKQKNFNLRLVITSALAMILLSSGCSIEPEDTRSYSFIVKSGSTALSNASVTIQTEYQNYATQTNSEGKCRIDIPNDVSLPDYVIATIEHNNARPIGFSVSGSPDSESNKVISCMSLPSVVLVNNVSLHHLGNDQYNGAANSQLQLAAEGIEKSYSFYLSNIPSNMPHIQIYARGIQERAAIKINGISTDYLNNSSSNGDLSKWDFQLTANPATVFKAGYNTLTIKTGANNSSDPWDDIEFCALLLYFP